MDGSISAEPIDVNILPANRALTLCARLRYTHEAAIGIDTTTSNLRRPNLADSAPPNGAQGMFIARDIAAKVERVIFFTAF